MKMSRTGRAGVAAPALTALMLAGCMTSPSSADISGTRWTGTETCLMPGANSTCGSPNPTPITYEFLVGGTLRFTSNGETIPTANVWTQNGNTVSLSFNGGFKTGTGTISGNRMDGSAQNVVGYRGSFTVTKQ